MSPFRLQGGGERQARVEETVVEGRLGATPLTVPDLRLAAAAAVGALVLLSWGDAFFLAVLLGVAALDAAAGLTAGGVATALLLRWGSSSLPAIAGAQAVLGPAVLVGPPLAVASTVAGAAALVAAAPPGPFALAFGAAAGLVAAGPSGATLPGLAVRLAAVAVGAALAWSLAPRLPRTGVTAWVAPVLAAVAVGCAAVARA